MRIALSDLNAKRILRGLIRVYCSGTKILDNDKLARRKRKKITFIHDLLQHENKAFFYDLAFGNIYFDAGIIFGAFVLKSILEKVEKYYNVISDVCAPWYL